MRSGPSVIRTLYANELRMVLRDRRTIMMAVVLPVLVMPVMLFASHWTSSRREKTLEETTYSYAVTGSEAGAARSLVDATRARLSTNAGKAPAAFSFREAAVKEPAAALERRGIDFYLDAVPGEEAVRSAERQRAKAKPPSVGGGAAGGATEEIDDSELATPGAPSIRMVFRADRDVSRTGFRKMRDALRGTRDQQRAALLAARGFPVEPAAVAAIVERNVATEGQVAGLTLGRMLTLMLLAFILSGGAAVATDSLAGEKERGTLETLLATAASRVDIVVAKHLVILTVALTITLIQVANFLLYIGFKLIPASAGFSAAVPPQVALLLLVLYLPLAALVSSVLLLTSGHARSYKEAQLYFFPIFLLGMVPALAPFLPGLTLRSAIVLVPVANLSVAVKEILIGAFDWPMIAVSWVVTALAAVWASRLAVRALSTERLTTGAEADEVDAKGGPALFSRHVLRWFAVMWAVVFAVAVNMPADTDIRIQIVINLVVVFFGATVLMIRRYRLDVREVLALRPVKPVVWLAVIAGAPASLFVGVGVFKLASLFVPVPPKMLESFGQALLPSNIPAWQAVALLSILPGIFEEITFRGALLYGLRGRLHPAGVALVVGLVFGLFHVALFRLAPTAALGVMLAAVTMMTGSIFPAMLWHAVNNGLALALAELKYPLAESGAGQQLAALAILAAAFWLVYRNRTPYPGLRPWRRPSSS